MLTSSPLTQIQAQIQAQPVAHYQLVKLILDQSIHIEPEIDPKKISIDLDRVDWTQTISDDRAFNQASSHESELKSYFWVSGGGTYLINDRYLPLVKRSDWAKVNPGKFSLFTGRADTRAEILDPSLLVRELFEELVLISGDRLYYPIYPKFQDSIGQIYQDLESKFNLHKYAYTDLPLRQIEYSDRQIQLKYQGKSHPLKLDFHINSKRDINVLCLFRIDLDIADLSAIDCEYHFLDQDIQKFPSIEKHHRAIYLYDLFTAKAKLISAPTDSNLDLSISDREQMLPIADEQMTEHLTYMIKLLQTYSLKTR